MLEPKQLKWKRVRSDLGYIRQEASEGAFECFAYPKDRKFKGFYSFDGGNTWNRITRRTMKSCKADLEYFYNTLYVDYLERLSYK